MSTRSLEDGFEVEIWRFAAITSSRPATEGEAGHGLRSALPRPEAHPRDRTRRSGEARPLKQQRGRRRPPIHEETCQKSDLPSFLSSMYMLHAPREERSGNGLEVFTVGRQPLVQGA